MFDILGIDWGEKKCGLAFGNSLTHLVIPSLKHNQTDKIIDTITKILKEKKIKTIVIGIPTNFYQKNTLITENIYSFGNTLKKITNIKIVYINENNTTKNIKDSKKNYLLKSENKWKIDNLVAQKILEFYFKSYN